MHRRTSRGATVSWLDAGQPAVMRALDRGPDFLPAALFAGSPERILAGMKVHANTISHARLIALEDTFPRTRELIGHERFNEHSRHYLEQPGVTGLDLPHLGLGFSGFLSDRKESAGVTDLARFEWLWLAAYHAADAVPLQLADLAGIAPNALMEVSLMRHPAARLSRFDRLVHDVIGCEVPDLVEAQAILISRPHAEVLVSAASPAMQAMLGVAETSVTIGHLLAPSSEARDPNGDEATESMEPLLALLNAGALTRS